MILVLKKLKDNIMAGIYTKLERELKECTNEEEKYKLLREYKREYDLTFEQINYVLSTI